MTDISELAIKWGELSVDEYIGGKSVHIIEFEARPELINWMLRQAADIDLCKEHRAMIATENFESAKQYADELIRRGFVITMKGSSIKYKRA